MQDDVVALFAYDRWANTKVLDACRKLTAEQYVAEPVPGWSSVRSTIYHISPKFLERIQRIASAWKRWNLGEKFMADLKGELRSGIHLPCLADHGTHSILRL